MAAASRAGAGQSVPEGWIWGCAGEGVGMFGVRG